MVPSETSSVAYVMNGPGPFPVTFRFLANSELVVRHTPVGGAETVWTEGVHYTVTGDGAAGAASIFITASFGVGDSLVLERTVPLTQPIDLTTQGPYTPDTIEHMHDESVFRDQQLDRRVKALESAGAVGSVVAGDGLSFSGSTLHVGAGNGILAAADSVSADYGAAGSVATVTKAAAGAGVSNQLARVDHKHDVSTAAPPAGAVVAGGAAAEGAATSLARSDHGHAVLTDVPVNVTKAAAAEGASPKFSRADHKHDVTTGVPATIGTANAEGAAASLARSDHGHDHGAQTDPTQHAVATNVANGFMSSADKAKLDAFASETSAIYTGQTTNATPLRFASVAPGTNKTVTVEVTVAARRSTSNTQGAGYKLLATFKNTDGVVTQVGATAVSLTAEDNAAWDCSFTVASPSVDLYVTGAAGVTVDWVALIRTVSAA